MNVSKNALNETNETDGLPSSVGDELPMSRARDLTGVCRFDSTVTDALV